MEKWNFCISEATTGLTFETVRSVGGRRVHIDLGLDERMEFDLSDTSFYRRYAK